MARKIDVRPFFFIIVPLKSFILSLGKSFFSKRPFLLGLLIFLFSSDLWAEEGVIRHVYLTWQHNPSYSATINLHGIKTAEELTLFYDTESHQKLSEYRYKVRVKGERKPKLSDKRLIYHVELVHLEPDTRYYFALQDQKEFSFVTLPEEPPYLFVEGGDWENTEEAKKLARQAAALNPHAVFLGGDYPSNVFSVRDYKKWDQWLDAYTSTMITNEGCLIPMVLAIGNHEVVGGFDQMEARVPFFLDYFKQGKKSYFALEIGQNIRLFVLDSGHAHSHEGAQRSWLEKELQKTDNVRTDNVRKAPIKIALYHVPLYPSVRFAEKGIAFSLLSSFLKIQKKNLFSYESYKGRKFWLPLFDRYHLTVAFEHHDQALKRTKLLKNGKVDPKGTLFLGDGGWGTKIHFPPIQGLFSSYFARLKGKTHFFWTLSIENEKITYSAISKEGKTIDNFTQKI